MRVFGKAGVCKGGRVRALQLLLALGVSVTHAAVSAQVDESLGLSESERLLIARNGYEFDQIEELCADGCVTRPALVEAARRATAPLPLAGTFIIDVDLVLTVPQEFSLHSRNRRGPDCVVIEIDPEIMGVLLNRYAWEKLNPSPSEEEIIVARKKRFIKPTIQAVRDAFAGRRVVVRGDLRVMRLPLPRRGEDGQIRIRLKSADDIVRVPVPD